jgi:hypothetical protein
MLKTIAGILALTWLVGFISHPGGWWIHLLLVVAVVMFVWNFLAERRTV